MSAADSIQKPRPVCFMVMPYGVKPTGVPSSSVPSKIDFDALWHLAFEPTIQALGYTPVRADHDIGAGIIHEMLERLALADVIVADLTIANANVYYEVGVRHAATKMGCVLTSADWAVPMFDVAQMRRIQYPLPASGVTEAAAREIRTTLERAVPELASAESPVFRLPGYPNVDASQTTSFKSFVDVLSEFQAEVRSIRQGPREKQRARVEKLIAEFSAGDDAEAVIPAVALELLNLVRDCLSWKDTVTYIESLPERLREQAGVQEQYWLARAKTGDRLEAVCHLEELVERHGSTATRQALIAGRYKRLYYDTEDRNSAKKYLHKAIEHYEEGLFLDLNEHCASSSLPTLLRERDHAGDRERADAIDRLAEFSCERAERLNLQDQWVDLTLLKAAFDERDPVKARECQERIERDDIVVWELEATLEDLGHGLDKVGDERARKELSEILEDLRQLI